MTWRPLDSLANFGDIDKKQFNYYNHKQFYCDYHRGLLLDFKAITGRHHPGFAFLFKGVCMDKLTLEEAKKINGTMVTEDHLILHAANVSAAMGAMARHFGQDPEEWEAVG